VPTGKRSYAKGIIAEAARWRNGDGQTPSDSDESYGGGIDAQRSAEVSFDENDLILVGVYHCLLWYRGSLTLLQWTITPICSTTLRGSSLRAAKCEPHQMDGRP